MNGAGTDVYGIQVQSEGPKFTCMTMAGPVQLPGNPPPSEADFRPAASFIDAIHRVQESRLQSLPARYFPY